MAEQAVGHINDRIAGQDYADGKTASRVAGAIVDFVGDVESLAGQVRAGRGSGEIADVQVRVGGPYVDHEGPLVVGLIGFGDGIGFINVHYQVVITVCAVGRQSSGDVIYGKFAAHDRCEGQGVQQGIAGVGNVVLAE